MRHCCGAPGSALVLKVIRLRVDLRPVVDVQHEAVHERLRRLERDPPRLPVGFKVGVQNLIDPPDGNIGVDLNHGVVEEPHGLDGLVQAAGRIFRHAAADARDREQFRPARSVCLRRRARFCKLCIPVGQCDDRLGLPDAGLDEIELCGADVRVRLRLCILAPRRQFLYDRAQAPPQERVVVRALVRHLDGAQPELLVLDVDGQRAADHRVVGTAAPHNKVVRLEGDGHLAHDAVKGHGAADGGAALLAVRVEHGEVAAPHFLAAAHAAVQGVEVLADLRRHAPQGGVGSGLFNGVFHDSYLR